MKVLKFGGTSVGSVQSIKTLIDILKRESDNDEKPVVVLSAMSGVTNLLSKMAQRAAAGEDFSGYLTELETRHFDSVKELLDVHLQNPVFTRLKILFNELEDILQGISSLREITPRTHDLVLSYGERCSAFLISKVAGQKLGHTVYVNAAEVIKTDSSFGQARVDALLTDLLIRDLYEKHKDSYLFVTGFIASNEEGRVTTLGRGGSDYTAALFGAALNASEIQIWTDVNGMMTADPRIVKKAFPLKELSYTEAMELSYFGAKVIYPPTMIPAFMKKIPIVIRNTFQPDFPGTLISHESHQNGHSIKGISSINDISVLNLEGSGMVGKAGFSGRLFSLLAREKINVIVITQSSSEHSITFAVNPADALRARDLIMQEFELEIHARKLDAPVIEDGLSIMAIVGEKMRRSAGVAGLLFHALGRNGVNIRAIAQGSSEYNISVIIARADLGKALNAVHDAFYTELKKTLNVFCLGTGNIGATFFKQLAANNDFLQNQNGILVKVIGVCNTRKMVFDQDGIDLDTWKDKLDGSEEPADLDLFIARMREMNLPNAVFVDNTASAVPVTYYSSIFSANISVVTCNKIGNSSSYAQYREFKDLALKHGVDFHYETNVGAGLPIIKTLKDLMMSGDRVLRIEAILSGTISFIFNNFKSEVSFHDIVKEAQQRGYTEPDPRDDLSGVDFMRKMLILARDAGYKLEPEDVNIQSMLPEACLSANSVDEFYDTLLANDAYFEELKKQAESAGKVLRYVGKLEAGKVNISLEMLDEQHPFYMLSGSDNIISFTTERYKERPLVVKGPGAGAEVTAAGVFADVVNVGS